MHRKRHQRNHPAHHGVPIEDAVLCPDSAVRPERLEEVAVGIERHPAYDVAQRCAEEDCQQNARYSEDGVEEALPDTFLNVRSELDADGAQHQEPEHHHQGKIESAEAGGVQQRKGEIQCATAGEQPNFVAVPHRSDGANHRAALVIGFGDDEVQSSSAEVEAIQQNVNRHHHCHNHEPNRCHSYRTSATDVEMAAIFSFKLGASTVSGPCSISRRTRKRNSTPSTVYIPANPRKLNHPLPAETIFE